MPLNINVFWRKHFLSWLESQVISSSKTALVVTPRNRQYRFFDENDVSLLRNYPAQSHYSSIIKNVWKLLKDRMYNIQQYSNILLWRKKSGIELMHNL